MTPQHTEQEMMHTEYSGKPVVQVLAIIIFLALVINAGTHLVVFIIKQFTS